MKKPVLFIASVILLIIVLSIVQIVVSNRLSTSGIVVDKLQTQIKELQKKNIMLQEQILALSSYETIASSAAALGFSEKTAQLVFSSPLPLAQK